MIDEVRFAAVQRVTRGAAGGVVFERGLQHGDVIGGQRGGEGIAAEGVGVVVKAAATDVRRADAQLDEVTAVGPRHHVVDANVVLGAERVVLRGAGGEITRHADARRLCHVLVAAEVVLSYE